MSRSSERWLKRALGAAQKRDSSRDLEGWNRFFLRGVAEVANEATETSRKIVDLGERHRALVVEGFGKGAANALKLLEDLLRRPFFVVPDVARLLGISTQAANTIAEKLVRMELVTEVTGQRRNRIFSYDAYITLFQDPPT